MEKCVKWVMTPDKTHNYTKENYVFQQLLCMKGHMSTKGGYAWMFRDEKGFTTFVHYCSDDCPQCIETDEILKVELDECRSCNKTDAPPKIKLVKLE